jgi:acyl-CoA synthetase (NDP forming)
VIPAFVLTSPQVNPTGPQLESAELNRVLNELPRRPQFKSPAPVLQPASLAIVGASERAKWPKQIYGQLKKFGFPGPIYPVNPRQTEVWGVKCYPDLAALPELPSHALLIIPAPAVQAVLETGVAAGLKSATIYSGFLGEGDDPEIVARGKALTDLIARSNLVVSGPNCMGLNSLRAKFFGYPATELCLQPAGSVALVSQSGGTAKYLAQQGGDRGIKYSHVISSGNEIDLDLADYINFFVDEPEIRTIALFIEGIRRPQTFMAAAARALAAGKPIVAIKTGKSQQAREAAWSHTGAIAGDYQVFAAMCERYGILLCHSLDDMIEIVLALQAGRLPKGRRVGFVTTSGGTVDLLYDYFEEIGGIETPEYADATKAAIARLVASETRIKNPLDAGDPPSEAVSIEMCKAVLDDPAVDLLAWAQVLPAAKGRDPAAMRSLVGYRDKPVIGFNRMNYMVSKDGLAFQDEVGFPFLQGLQPTLRALAALTLYGARSGSRLPPLPEPRGAAEAVAAGGLAETLAAAGMPAPASFMAATADTAAVAAQRIGFPVALKIVSPRFTHKTEVGGVLLDLDSAEKVADGAAMLAARMRKADPTARIDGFLVQEMVRGVELILGARNDAQFGPIIVVGAGGILVELTRDLATRLLPVGAQEARQMIDGLKVRRLLAGYRGAPAADIAAAVRAICGLSDLFLQHAHLLRDIEINPLVVLPAGQGVRAVDVRVLGAAGVSA